MRTQILFDAEVTGLRRLDDIGIDHDRSPCDSTRHSQLELSVRQGKSPNSSSVLAEAATLPSVSAAASPSNDIANNSILCKYVIAADGAGSSVREAAGIGLSGRRELGNLVNIHFRCESLGQLLLGDNGLLGKGRRHRTGMLYFVYNEV